MTGFLLWIREQNLEFCRAHPECCYLEGIVDFDAWDRWLETAPKGATQ